MKSIRIKISQSKACYGRPETVYNKMTFPLPHPSTIIGALHKACGYQEYHQMDVSIQGDYQQKNTRLYRNMTVLNRVEIDRGTLAFFPEGTISNGHIKIAKAKAQGADITNGKNIEIINQEAYNDWRNFRKEYSENPKKRKALSDKIKSFRDKKRAEKIKRKEYIKDETYVCLQKELDDLDAEYKRMSARKECYRTIEYIPMHIEELTDIELVLHVRAEEDVMQDILDHIYNLKAVGRSEDFVNVQTAEMVELSQGEEYIGTKSRHHAYIKDIDCFEDLDGENIRSGTKYFIYKDYEIVDGKRVFSNAQAATWISEYRIKKFSKNIFVDEDGYIVDFI